MQKLLALALLAMALTALIWAFSSGRQHAPASVQAAASGTAHAPPATAAPANTPEPPVPALAQPAPVALIDTLFTTRDGAAFVDEAVRHPEAGGIYYARHVLSKCKKEAELAGTGITSSEAIDAHARGIKLTPRRAVLPGLCATFDSARLDKSRPEDLEARGVAENDMLYAALAALRKARAMRSHAATQAALQRVLALKNPVLLQLDGLELLRQKTGVLWFEAQSYPFDDETLLNAMLLVPCDFGLPCGEQHTMVARHCRIMQRCYASLEELIAREGDAAAEGSFARSQVLRRRVTQAIARADAAAFLPPKKEFEEVVPEKYAAGPP